jgi:hypothetical protein
MRMFPTLRPDFRVCPSLLMLGFKRVAEALLARVISILTAAASSLPGDISAIRPLSPAPEDPAE